MTMEFVLDKTTILKRFGGDEGIFVVMANMYLQDVDSICTRLNAALADNDTSLLRREAHTIKGLLATLADETGAALALSVETLAKSGECIGMEAMVSELQSRMRLVAAAVRKEIAS